MDLNPMIIVFAHDDYQAMFDMNLPHWEKHGAPILVVCPNGRSVRSKHEVVEFGNIGSLGPQMVERHLKAMEHALLKPIYYFVFFECDAICVSKRLPLRKGLWGNTFRNIHSGWGHAQEDWITWQYLNFPWVIDRESLQAFVQKARQYPDIIEGGYVDRWVPAIAQAAGVPMVRFIPRGYSRSEIKHDEPGEMEELERVIKGGGTMFHGVKFQRDLDKILALRRKYFPNDP